LRDIVFEYLLRCVHTVLFHFTLHVIYVSRIIPIIRKR
jgi:hypothetical protein